MRKTTFLLMLMLPVSAKANDWLEAWHNSDKWGVAGDARLNSDNSRHLIGKPAPEY